MKDLVKGVVITVIIGGSAYTISQGDVINNFAEDTGLTQEQAEEYVTGVGEDELASFDEIGSVLISDGREGLGLASGIDCVNYEYEWESTTLSCPEGKQQLTKLAKDSISLGQAYKKLDSDSASDVDIAETISLIDKVNADYEFAIVRAVLDPAMIDEMKKTNSFNRAVLKAALESE